MFLLWANRGGGGLIHFYVSHEVLHQVRASDSKLSHTNLFGAEKEFDVCNTLL